MSLGQRLRQYRKSVGKTLCHIADDVGLTVSQISGFERGTVELAPRHVARLAEMVGAIDTVYPEERGRPATAAASESTNLRTLRHAVQCAEMIRPIKSERDVYRACLMIVRGMTFSVADPAKVVQQIREEVDWAFATTAGEAEKSRADRAAEMAAKRAKDVSPVNGAD